MSYKFEKCKDMSLILQKYSRHSFIEKILQDVLTDISVCKLEGWNWREYPEMIKKEMEKILKK